MCSHGEGVVAAAVGGRVEHRAGENVEEHDEGSSGVERDASSLFLSESLSGLPLR